MASSRHPARRLYAMLSLLVALAAALPARPAAAQEPPLPPPSAAPAAPAEPVAPAAPAAFKEHWYGYGWIDGYSEHAVKPNLEWYEPEVNTGSSLTEYDLYVAENGTLWGTLRVKWNGTSSIQAGAVDNCLPAIAENSYHGYDCRISLQPTSGAFTLQVEGTRTREANGDVRFRLEAEDDEVRAWRTITGIQFDPDGGWQFTHRSPSHVSNFFPPDSGSMDFQGPPRPYNEFVLVEASESVRFDYGCCTHKRANFRVELVELGSRPLLRFDKELLERSVFMDQVSVPDALTANLTWQTAGGGKTDWRLPTGPETTPLSTQTTVQRSVDVGAVGVGEHTVTVKGTDSLDRTTMEEIVKVVAARYFSRCPDFKARKVGQIVVYRCEVKVPEKPLEARINKVWDIVPFFGGKPLGLGKTQFTARVEIKSTGEGSVRGEGNTLFDVMGGQSGGRIVIKGDLLFKPDGVYFTGGSIEVNLAVKAKQNAPLLKAIPALRGPLAFLRRFAPPAADYLENLAGVELALAGLFGPKFRLINDPDPAVGWRYEDTEVKARLEFYVEAALKFWEGKMEGKAKVAGETVFTFDLPPNPDYLKSVELKFLASLSLVAIGYSNTFENLWVFTWPGGITPEAGVTTTGADLATAALSAGPVYTSTTGWVLRDRAYLTQPGYSQWAGALADNQAVRGDLVARTSYWARPDFLPHDNYRQWLVWSYERPDGGAIGPDNGGEIAFANLGSAASYRPLGGYTLMTSDDRNDLNPQLAARNNLPVVVWERMDTPTPGSFPNAPEAYLSHIQVAASIFTPTIASPTLAPVQISTPGTLNHRPQVAGRGGNNELFVAVWVNNPTNMLMGDAGHPDRFMYSFYNRNTKAWTAPLDIPGNVPGIQSFDVGSWRDESGTPYRFVTTLAYISGGELYVTEFRNTTEGNPATGSWSPIKRVTNNTVEDRDIQIEFVSQWGEGNDLVATWRAGDTLMALRGTGTNAWGGAPQAVATLPVQAGPPTLAPTRYPAGPVVAWTEPGGIASVRLTGDPPAWTKPRLLATGGRTPASVLPANALDSNSDIGTGPVFITHMETNQGVTRTVAGWSIPNFPAVVRRDLAAIPDPTRKVSLTIVAESVQVIAGTPLRVAATIWNDGDVDAGALPLELVARPLAAGTVVVAQQAVAVPNNTRVPVTLTLPAAPPAGATLALRLGDESLPLPADAVASVGGPTSYSPGATVAQLYVSQEGPLLHPATFEVRVRKGSGGPVVASVGAQLPTTPTVEVAVSAPISPAVLGPGTHILEWEIVADGPVRDPNPANNGTTSLAIVAPDLYITPYLAGLAGSTVQARVENRGNWPSVATVLEVWSSPPGTTGASKLGSAAVPPLAPGAHADVSVAVPAGAAPADTADAAAASARYLVLDPGNLVAEIDENSNLTAIAGAATPSAQFTILLPLVEK